MFALVESGNITQMPKGNKGITLKKPNYLINKFEYFFSEDQGRYIVEVKIDDLKKVTNILEKNSIHFDEIGIINKNELIIDDKSKVSIDELTNNDNGFKRY